MVEFDDKVMPWSASDDDLAAAVWAKLSESAKSLFSVLIEHPGTKFSGAELAEILSIPSGRSGVAATLCWPKRHCAALGRGYLWSWGYPADKRARYWMTDEVAELLDRVRKG
ncbi:DUF6416 domain-containing protein [Amycolatopsis anabasis]|uniref:DUF6416 domain-containing protein n=1 Tax=Amycolatopsis anabasis TaxID=1840409 RepID=UPI00131D87D1|nr:DUF6416 domain-containing protein [Amycolatopsis anabasis]